MALQAYRHFLQKHSTAVASFESLISSATWLLPERFSASETPAEALNSLSGLFSVFNEHLLRKTPESREQLLLACLYQVRHVSRTQGHAGHAEEPGLCNALRRSLMNVQHPHVCCMLYVRSLQARLNGPVSITPREGCVCGMQTEALLEITAHALENRGSVRSRYSALLILEALKCVTLQIFR